MRVALLVLIVIINIKTNLIGLVLNGLGWIVAVHEWCRLFFRLLLLSFSFVNVIVLVGFPLLLFARPTTNPALLMVGINLELTKPVLWIRIRKDPGFFAGSEIRGFGSGSSSRSKTG
jgi:hypothetical protein